MGLRYVAGESAGLVGALSANVVLARSLVEELELACDGLVGVLGGGELSGQAYGEAREVFVEAVGPGLVSALEEIAGVESDLGVYREADGLVSRYGSLDEDLLREQLSLVEMMRCANESQIDVARGLAAGSGGVLAVSSEVAVHRLELVRAGLDDDIRELNEKLSALLRFDAETRGLFSFDIGGVRGSQGGWFSVDGRVVAGFKGDSELRAFLDGIDEFSPEEINDWFVSLSGFQQRRLVDLWPDVVGNADGIPPAVRDECNRLMLDREILRIEQELAEAERAFQEVQDDLGGLAGIDGPAVNTAEREHSRDCIELLELNSRLGDLVDLRDQLDEWEILPDNAGTPLQLLGFRAGTPHVQAIVAVGDISTATNIITHVSGMTTKVRGRTVLEAMTTLRLQGGLTKDLIEGGDALGSSSDMGPVAGVFWLGYDAPDWDETLDPSRSVLTSAEAVRGGEALVRFSQGLQATSALAQGPVSTLTAHSYGTEVGFYALSDKNHCFDRAVFSGSPGYPRTEVFLNGDDLYFATNPTDYVSGGTQLTELTYPGGIHGKPVRALYNVKHLRTGSVTAGDQEFASTNDQAHGYIKRDEEGRRVLTSTDYNTAVVAAGDSAPALAFSGVHWMDSLPHVPKPLRHLGFPGPSPERVRFSGGDS